MQQLVHIWSGQNAVIGHVLRHDSGLSRLQKHRRMNINMTLYH